MTTPRKATARLDLVGSKDSSVSEFVGVMGKLKALFAEENDLLSQGLPASMLETIEQKEHLSAKYGALGNNLVDQSAGQILSDGALQEKLLVATAQLVAMSEENRQLLCNALAATRRRIDNVMEAVRVCEDSPKSLLDQPSPKRRKAVKTE
jgi:hypothetical protein